MLSIIMAIVVGVALCVGINKFVAYGKENNLYKNGYLEE